MLPPRRKIHFAVQVSSPRGAVEAELAHPKARLDAVASRAALDHIQKGVFGRPQAGLGDWMVWVKVFSSPGLKPAALRRPIAPLHALLSRS